MTHPAPTPPVEIPRAAYGLWMAAATAVALGAAWLVASRSGGTPQDTTNTLIALSVGSLATLAPILLRVSREYWGVLVLGSGVARVMIALAVAYTLATRHPNETHRPLFMGLAAGAFLLLIVETVLTVKVLSAIERRLAAHSAAPAHPSSPAQA
ncbi:MAG: hypothetical protein K2Q09_07490 [Phycisphaerales bacterium]|nr:hypothetical protein [Phycisphaerales bacterium]